MHFCRPFHTTEVNANSTLASCASAQGTVALLNVLFTSAPMNNQNPYHKRHQTRVYEREKQTEQTNKVQPLVNGQNKQLKTSERESTTGLLYLWRKHPSPLLQSWLRGGDGRQKTVEVDDNMGGCYEKGRDGFKE